MVYVRKSEVKNLICLFLSFCSACSLIYYLNIGVRSIFITNSVSPLFIFFAFYFIIVKSFNILNKRLAVVSYLLSFCFATMLFVGREVAVYNNISLSIRNIIIKGILIICLSFIICAIISILIYYIPDVRDRFSNTNLEKYKNFTKSRKYLFLVWAFIFMCWIPCLLSYFPGIFSYDVAWQIKQAFRREFTSHHPICHTLYIYICLKVGNLIGSYNIGILLYSVSQMVVLSAIFAYACYYISKYDIPVVVQILVVLYFALVPINPLFAINATKDVLFSAFFLVLFIKSFDMVLNTDDFFSGFRSPVIFLIFSVLMMCFRNQGPIVYILFIPFLVLFLKSNKKKAMLLVTLSLLVYICFIGFINKNLDVKKGRIAEAMSVPLQQIARTAFYADETLTENEKESIHEFISEKGIKQYNPYLSDFVKGAEFDEKLFKEQPKKFIKLWVKLGLKYPGIYLDSFLNNYLGYWYPDATFLNEFGHRYIETSIKEDEIKRDGMDFGLHRKSLWPRGEKIYDKIAIENVFYKIPIVSMLFSIGFFSMWNLLFIFMTFIYYKKFRFIIPMLLLFLLMFSVIVSPMVLLRYAYPIFVSIPVLFSLLFNNDKKFSIDNNIRRK